MSFAQATRDLVLLKTIFFFASQKLDLIDRLMGLACLTKNSEDLNSSSKYLASIVVQQ